MPTLEDNTQVILKLIDFKLKNSPDKFLVKQGGVSFENQDFTPHEMTVQQFFATVSDLFKKGFLKSPYPEYETDKKELEEDRKKMMNFFYPDSPNIPEPSLLRVALLTPYRVYVVPDFKEKYSKFLEDTKKEKRKKLAIIHLDEGTVWEDITIRFLNKFDVEILVKDKFIGKYSNVDLGFFKGKDGKATEQWELLIKLSFVDNKVSLKRLQHLDSTGRNVSNNENISKEDNKLKKQKQNLEEKLQEIFNLYYDSPFYDHKEIGYYKPRFTLLPVPELRKGREEVWMTRHEEISSIEAGRNDDLAFDDDISSNDETLPDEDL